LSHLYIETILLPRQAPGKHRESSEKSGVSLGLVADGVALSKARLLAGQSGIGGVGDGDGGGGGARSKRKGGGGGYGAVDDAEAGATPAAEKTMAAAAAAGESGDPPGW
jgi:hypothetical protein